MFVSYKIFIYLGLTFKAISSNGDLLGVILNDIILRDDTELENCNEENQEKCVKFKEFMNIFQKVKQESDVFRKYPDINRIMDIKIVAVDEAFRGQGVCKALFEKSKYVDIRTYTQGRLNQKYFFFCYIINYIFPLLKLGDNEKTIVIIWR